MSAALTVWLLFDPNDYKDDLSALVETRTGREFAIEDDLQLTFFPWLGVQTGGIRLGNADGFGDEDFASAASATVRVRLFPLLSKRLEIGTLELDGLELNLARDGGGRGNWEDLLAPASADEPPGTPATTGGDSVPQDLDIAGVNIRDGLIFWRENVTDVRYVLSELSLETGPIVIGQPIDAALEFQIVGVEPQFTAQLDVRTIAAIDTSASRYTLDDLQLDFRLEDGQHDERATGRLEANVEYSGENASLQITTAEFDADLTAPPVGPEQLTVRAAVERAVVGLDTQTTELQGLTTTVGDMVAEWQITGTSLLDDPQLAGTVNIAEGSLEEALSILNLDLETDADLGSFSLRSRFAVEPGNGNVTLTELEGSALDMTFAGEIAITEQETAGSVEALEFDPSTLFDVLPPEAMEGLDISTIDTFAFAASFSINGVNQVFSLREFTAAIPGATFTGALDRLEDGRRMRGRITTSDVAPEVFLSVFPDRLPEDLGPDRLGTISVNTAFDYSATDDQLQLSGLSAQALGLQTTGELVVGNLSDSPRLTGSLDVQPFSPRALFTRFDQPVPVTSDATALTNATISATVDVTQDRGQFDNLRIRLDDTTLTGRFTVENFDDPNYVFNLAADRLDVDRYLAPAGPTEDHEGPAAGDLLLPAEPLHTLALQGQVSVTELRMAGLSFTNLSTELSVEDGIGRVESARTQLYGGEFEGGLELDARAGGPTLALNGSAIAIELDSLLMDLSGQSTLSGTGTFDLELAGAGPSLNDALSTAVGHVDFALRDGAIQGFNLNHGLCDAFNRLKGYPRPAPTDQQLTPYSLMRGTTRVSDGIARTDDLVASTPSIDVTGRGQMDLVSRGINYDLEAGMTNAIPIAGCETLDSAVGDSIPFEVSGTVTEPVVLPDFGELLKREVQDDVQDRIRDRLQELLGN